MFYRNTRYAFPLPAGTPDGIAGGIIAAAAIKHHRLNRRARQKAFVKNAYLQHRLFDPQLYLAGLNKMNTENVVVNLASHPWFVDTDVPEFHTGEHGKLETWEAQYEPALLEAWTGQLPTDSRLIDRRIKKAIQAQLHLECEAVILPGPLTAVASDNCDVEMYWLDAGLRIFRDMNVPLPVFATVALTQNVLAGYAAEAHPTLAAFADQLTARELDGVYFVMEQTVETQYCPREENTLKGILSFIDDIVRSGRRRMITNYLGAFGAVTTAAGTEIWSTDFYRSCRGLRMTELLDRDGGSQRPRYFSPALIGDLGLQADLEEVSRQGLLRKVRLDTQAAGELHESLARGDGITYEWQHAPTRTTAAKAHYLEAMMRIGRKLNALGPRERVGFVHKWLQRSVVLAGELVEAGISPGYYTELQHQESWLRAYEWWMRRAKFLS